MRLFGQLAATLICLACFTLGGCSSSAAPQERFMDVDAGGHDLHMLVVGEEGPVVVLESGWPGCGLGWERVRGPVAQFAQVVTYDRAGTGKSDAGPEPRDARHIAAELRLALRNAGLPPPYILVGQSFGGPYIRVFAGMYPDDVSGMVLVDPTQPERLEPVEEVKTWLAAHAPEQLERVEAALLRVEPPGYDTMVASEFKRLEQHLAGLPEPRRTRLRREWWSQFDQSLPAGKATMSAISPGARGEMKSAAATFRQAILASPLPDAPIVLLTAGEIQMDTAQAMNPLSRELFEESLSAWNAGHQQWVDQTPGARLVVAKMSGHNIQSEQPQVVIDAIRDVVEQAAQMRPSAK